MEIQHFNLNDDFEGIIKSRCSSVVEISKIPTGWTNYVFEARTRSGRKYVFRFPRHDFWVESLKKEIWFNKFIKDKIKFKTVDLKYRTHEGRGYSMHRYVSGRTMTEAYPTMSAGEKAGLASDIADYIIALQKVDVSGIELPLFSEFHIGLAQVNGDKNFDYMNIFKPLFKEEKKDLVLVHGDFNQGNILVDKNNKMIAVLDYAFASMSAGPADLAVLLARSPMADFRELMISTYEKKVGKKLDRKVFEDFVSARVEVESDYVRYMARCHKDVVLPKL